MKKCLFVILCLFGFVGSVCACSQNEYKVIKVIDGDTIYIDFNRNNFPDADEKVRVNGIDTFENKKNPALQWQMQNYNLTFDEALGLGYFAQEYAKKELLNKYVKVEYTANTKFDANNRHLMSIYYDCKSADISSCKSYEQEVLKEGLAKIYTKSNIADKLQPFVNNESFEKYVSKARKMDLVVRNRNSGKIHKTTCDYAWASGDVELIKKPIISKKVAGCCFKSGNDDLKFYYIHAKQYTKPSDKTRTEAGKELIKLINSAQKTIDFAFYGFSHQDDILYALLNAQKRGVKIRGVVDINVFGKNDYTGTASVMRRFGDEIIKSDYKAELDKQAKIKAGIVKYEYDYFYGHIMHNKFCIVDDKWVWSGTANISSTGTGGFNENIVNVIKSPEIAKLYKQEFEQMFVKGKFHENKQPIFSTASTKIGDATIKLYFSPNKNIIYDAIIPEINNAQHYIYISMFLITNHKIVDSIINAHKRGVDVKLIVEANHAQQQYTLHETLRNAGIPVKVENWAGKMHAKTAVIDDSTIISGSANWTSSAFKYNDENLSVYKNVPQQAVYLKKEFLKSWKAIPNKWLYKNPLPEGKDSPYSCSDGIDNDHNGLIDADDPACKGVWSKKPTSYNYDSVSPHER